MNIIELAKYLLHDEAAEEYLRSKGVLKTFTECPFCGAGSVGKMRRSTMKCYKCRKEWHRRRGSILESKHVSSSLYLGLIKLFSYGFSVNRISQELALDYKSVVELTDTLKYHLIKEHFDIKLVDSKKFLLIENQEKEEIEVKQWAEESEKELSSSRISFGTLEIIRTKSYDDNLTFTFEFRWIFKQNRRKVYTVDRFLSFFSERVAIYRGVSYSKFAEYFLGALISYNKSDQDYFQVILDSINYAKIAHF